MEIYDYSPVWSPDGNKIAFISGDMEPGKSCLNCTGSRLYLVDDDGSNITKLTDFPFRTSHNMIIYVERPVWSPDGKKIAFVSNVDRGERGLFVINSDGSELVALSEVRGSIKNPIWSPDGENILFSQQSNIYIINKDGSNPRKLEIDSLHYQTYPQWSPDGNWVGYINTDGEFNATRKDGKVKIQITSFPNTGMEFSWRPLVTWSIDQ